MQSWGIDDGMQPEKGDEPPSAKISRHKGVHFRFRPNSIALSRDFRQMLDIFHFGRRQSVHSYSDLVRIVLPTFLKKNERNS